MSATFKISEKELARELRKRGEGARRAIQRGTRSAAMRGRGHLVRKADFMGLVDMGQFKNAFRVKSLGVNKGSEIVNDAPHAGIIERGARPHPVNAEGIEALAGWAMRKLGLDPVAAKSAAFAIAAKLKKEGQKPTWLVRDELPQLGDWLVSEVRRELEKYSGAKP